MSASPIAPTDRGMWRVVARRDFWVRLRDRGFVISTLITLTVLTILILIRAASGPSRPSFELGTTGQGSLASQASALGSSLGVPVEVVGFADAGEAERAIAEGRVDAALIDGQLVGADSVPAQLEQLVQAAAIAENIQQALDEYGVPQEVQRALADRSPVTVRTLQPADPDRQSNGAIAFVGVILLYGQLFGYGVWISTGVIEEKSSRVVELLLAAVRPRVLMAGKIVGIGLLGLFQLACIATFAITLAVLTGAIDVPVTAVGVALMDIGWFVLGFAFYAGLFAVAGALVSRMEELQNAMVPINLVILVSLFISIDALRDPGGMLSRVASILPTSSALAMPVRITLGAAQAWEVAAAVSLLIAGTAALIPLSGRLYAGAILRTGARVKLRDAWRTTA